MTKFRGKSGSMLSTKRHALLGATALALMAASQNVYAGAPAPGTALAVTADAGSPLAADAPVIDLLSVPLTETGTGTDPISVVNEEPISVADNETGITLSGESGDVTLVNSGDISGGIGISVTTGTLSTDPSQILDSVTYDYSYDRTIYVVGSGRVPQTHVVSHDVSQLANADQSDATIQIDNSGDISFSGASGIKAVNETGQSITISNSGDIGATSTTEFRVGIFASTYSPATAEYEINNFVPGEYTITTYSWSDYVTGVITPGELEFTRTSTFKYNDGGTIWIENNGTIDTGPVDAGFAFGSPRRSQGILATSFEGIEIVNNGTIRVGDVSSGITANSAGNATIVNNGQIEIGNASYGIFSSSTRPNAFVGAYLKSGDVTIINSGDISGGMTDEEALSSENYGAFFSAYTTGIRAYSLGANSFYGLLLEHEELARYYVDKLTELGRDPSIVEVPTFASDFPKLKLYTTNIVNEGTINLKDGGVGISGTALLGDLNAVNSGSIIVGDGHTSIYGPARSSGIYLENFDYSGDGFGYADMTAHNTQTGIIFTGDDSSGMMILENNGSGTALNEGSITTGDGRLAKQYNWSTGSYNDRLFTSYGMSVVTMGYSLGQKATAINSGDISVGEFAIGVNVSGYSERGGIIPDRVTGEIVNSGAVTAGDNSVGLMARGNVVAVANAGAVTIGDRDLSGFDPAKSNIALFNRMGHGIFAAGYYSTLVENDGTVTTGDGAIGIESRMLYSNYGYAAAVIQGETGAVSTGDNSVGVRVAGNLYSWLDNQGHISTGDNSVAVEAYGGGVRFDYYYQEVKIANAEEVRAINSGIIETGDNSVGVRLLGNRKGEYSWQQYVHTGVPYPWSGEMRYYTGEADISGAAYFSNSGTIRVGANSTAVEITGQRITVVQNGEEYLLPHLVNSGTIEAGAGGTALRINASGDIAPTDIDSYVVNLGTISGDIFFGDGDDRLLNGQDVVDRQVLSTGNIILNSNSIDFGGGTNTFQIERGVISVSGGDNLITGDNLTVEMDGGEIEARDAFVAGPATLALAAAPFAASTDFSTLTIDGDVSGTFSFAADVGAGGESDELIITGNVADGSEIGVILNPVEQLKGTVEIRPINIGGTNDADVIEVAGVTGAFAESLIGSEAHYDAATGDIVINATFGMSHLGTAVAAATTMTQNWWLQSVGSYERRNPITLGKHDGLSVWASAFTDVGTMRPENGQQDVSFNQQLLGTQIGLSFAKEIGGARLAIGPMVSYGQAKVKLEANKARSTGNGWAYGVNGNLRLGGFYLDAIWQKLAMDVDFSTPNSLSGADGKTDAKGRGFNVETGYAYKLKSGLTLAPQLQYARVKVDLDDVASLDGVYSLTKIGGKASLLRAGVTVSQSFETASGSVTPLFSLSFINAGGSDGSHLLSNGVEFANDTKGPGFKAELGMNGAYKAWDIGVRTGISDTSKSTPSLSSSLTARYRW